jgi:hypothetical protein
MMVSDRVYLFKLFDSVCALIYNLLPRFVQKNAGDITTTAAAATGKEGEEVLDPLVSIFDYFNECSKLQQTHYNQPKETR